MAAAVHSRSRSPADLPRVRITAREEPFAITGSTASHLRLVLGALGPVRGGVRFGAYTDWEIVWRYQPAPAMEKAGFLRADHVAVDVTAIVILPYWRVPRSAKDELVARWEHYIAALRAHERGHVAIAGAAGRAVAEQIAAISPCGSLDSLKRAVAEAASAAVAEHRERERAYDTETQHGALEGVRLPEEYGL